MIEKEYNNHGTRINYPEYDSSYQRYDNPRDESEDEEEMDVENKLTEYAEWKRIQSNTFTRWTNEQLKIIERHIENIETDLADGINLIALVEILSGKQLPKYNKSPSFRSQKLENVSLVLQFLQETENIRIVNIDSSDIVDSKLKLILGLIWTLILHYSIVMPIWDDEISNNNLQTSPKQRLMQWINSKIPNLNITNFTTDWNDGKAIGALVDAIAPGLCPAWMRWNSTDALGNTNDAISAAQDYLNISQLINPVDIINPNIDEQSVMTYLSQFPNAKLKKGTILPQNDLFRRVRVYGPGVESAGLATNVPVGFTVNPFGTKLPSLNVKVENPKMQLEPIQLRANDDENATYSVRYTPRYEGEHKVFVKIDAKDVKGSPFVVHAYRSKGDPTKVSVFGPGIKSNEVFVNRPTYFDISIADAGNGTPDVLIKDVQRGTQDAIVDLYRISPTTWRCNYLLKSKGSYLIDVLFAGAHTPCSPYRVIPGDPPFESVAIDKISDIKVDGLEETVPVNSLQQFRVITPNADVKAQFCISITTPSGSKVKALVIPTHEGYLVNFTPTQLGEYLLSISFGGEPIGNKPFKITCHNGSDPKKVKAMGPGLHRGIVCRPAEFLIDTRGAGQGGLGVTIEGPCEAAINCRDNGDGTCSVAYLPTEIGQYDINITFNNTHIADSPYQAIIVPEIDVNKIIVSGYGVQLHGVFINTPTDFLVDAGKLLETAEDNGKVNCTIRNPSGAETSKSVTPLSNGIYKVSYTPFEEGRHTIDILYGNIPVPGSPFVVNVQGGCDVQKVRVFGPGLEVATVGKDNFFAVNTSSAGSGKLGFYITGPSQSTWNMIDNQDGSCFLKYIPKGPGEYTIAVSFSGQPIPGSPFKVVAEYEDEVRVCGPVIESKECRAGVPSEFTIDASKSLRGPISVNFTSDNGQFSPKPTVRNLAKDIYNVQFEPPINASKVTARVLQNNKDIESSPFEFRVLPHSEPDKIKVNLADKDKVLASLPTEIIIDTRDAGIGVLEVNVRGPDNDLVDVDLQENNDGTYKAVFVPGDCGTYVVAIKYGGEIVPGCPYITQAYTTGWAEKCKITEGAQKNLYIGEEYCITVNTEDAGPGAVTCKVRPNTGKSDLDIKIVDNGDGTFSIFYNVPDSGEYTINIKFGGQTVPGGFYTFRAKETSSKRIEGKSCNDIGVSTESQSVQNYHASSSTTIYRQLHLERVPLTEAAGIVAANIKMPSGFVDQPLIEDNHDGTVSIKYDPREEGLHELSVKYNGEPIQGSPFKFHVDSISSGYVTAYGPGLTHGVTGEPSNFTISTKGLGACKLSIVVEGPSHAEIICHDNKDGTTSVSYLPTVPGEYKIFVRHDEKHIKGSPYIAKITGEGRKRNQISVGTCSEVSLPGKISDGDIRSLNASIQAPSGLEEPCFLKRFPTGNIGISFTPREVGEHVVSVKKLGKHITNSPFKLNVGLEEVGDAKKVKVTGTALKEGKTHVDNKFSVDTRNAGFGGLSLSIEGPSKAEIQSIDKEDGTLDISYKPTEPGYYIVNLKFADHHVDGSPFTVKVTGEGTNRQREKIQRIREAVPLTEVGSQCKLTFKMPGITSFDLSASVTSPGGVMEDAVIKEVQDGLYAVHFVPKELGIHTVSVKYKDIHIPGSPFQFTVGPLKDSGSHLVKAGGSGLERGEQGAVNEFNVWTREAGKGQLVISVEGPSRAEINFTDRKDGSCEVAYKVSEPGEYRIGLKFNDEHVPDSPFKVYISPAVGDANLLEVAQFPEGAVQADKPSQFMVRKNGAKGDLDAKIVGPSGHEEDCFIQLVDLEEYSVRFMPRENGIHKIHAKFNGVHIPGSPFYIRVGKDTADPAAVHAAGPGLKDIKTGVKTDFIIDTVNAGSGTLAVTIDGPSKVSMDCTEVEEGYKVRYTPLAPGDYFISVKYNNNHIVASPFRVHCTGNSSVVDIGSQETSSTVVETVAKVGKPIAQGPKIPKFNSDASKVTSKGMGLKKAYLGKQNQFTISANNAGANFLFVGIHGPKGPCEEVSTKHTGRDQYTVSYLVRDRGDYIIIVKWGDDHIPGSPFKVEV